MKEIKAILYGEPGNNAVVRLPDRKFPGILIQGDTLRNLVETSELVAKLARQQGREGLVDEADGLVEMLRDIYEGYKREVPDV